MGILDIELNQIIVHLNKCKNYHTVVRSTKLVAAHCGGVTVHQFQIFPALIVQLPATEFSQLKK
jgi:hypothetical protein